MYLYIVHVKLPSVSILQEFVFVLGISTKPSWNMHYLLGMQITHNNFNELQKV